MKLCDCFPDRSHSTVCMLFERASRAQKWIAATRRKIYIGFAKVFFIRVEWPIADKGSQINHYLNIVYVNIIIHFLLIEGSLEVKLPTTWADGKAEVGRVREEKKKEDERRERVRGKTVQVHEKVEKVFFQWFVAPEGRKVGSLKCRVRSHLARWEMKNCRCGGKHISKSKCAKHTILGALLEVEMFKNCTPLWREANFEVNSAKKWRVLYGHFWTFKCPSAWQAQGIVCTLSKVSKTWGFCSISKNDGRRGTFEEDLARCISVAGAVQETCSSEMFGGPGAYFLRGVAFWSMRSSGLLRWFCVTGAALPGITFSWQAQHFRHMQWKKRTTSWYEAVSSALNFPFLKEVLQNCFVLMLSTWKIEDVSQTCFVFDVVKFKNWRSLAGVLRFWCCQVQEVSQYSFVFKLADRQIDRQTNR